MLGTASIDRGEKGGGGRCQECGAAAECCSGRPAKASPWRAGHPTRRLCRRAWLLLASIAAAAPALAGDRIGDIEFFGYKGLDVATIRKTLPVHEGDEYSDRAKYRVRQAVERVTGKEPTDVAAVCCDEKGNRLLFIGLPGLLGSPAHRAKAWPTIQSLRARNAFRRRS